jgi:hypothetical protein
MGFNSLKNSPLQRNMYKSLVVRRTPSFTPASSALTTVDKREEVTNINIYDLYRNINEKKQKRVSTFNVALRRCHSKIHESSMNEMMSCLFTVPEYIIGEPLYKLNECIAYIMKQLRQDGFLVKYYPTKVLYISWDPTEIKAVKSGQSQNSSKNKTQMSFNKEMKDTEAKMNKMTTSFEDERHVIEQRQKKDVRLEELVKSRENVQATTNPFEMFSRIGEPSRSGSTSLTVHPFSNSGRFKSSGKFSLNV